MKVFAVAGNPVSHSKSPPIMNHVMQSMRMNAWYTRILAANVADIGLLAEEIPLTGLNITAPFKKDVLKLAYSVDEIVRTLGAANTLVRNKNGLLTAHNTDVKGVRDAVQHLFREDTAEQSEVEELIMPEPKKVLVLGNGGAASASIKALEIFRCEVFVSGRNNEKTRELAAKTGAKTFFFSLVPQKIDMFHLIINTIPVKVPMFEQFSFLPDQNVMDAAYSHPPLMEKCVSEGANYISGEQWLIHQAVQGFKYFTGKWVNKEKFTEAISMATSKIGKSRLPSIALTGPMGSGKTTVGKLLAEKLGYEWVDTDHLIEAENNTDIAGIFRNHGEAYFRNQEKKLLEKLVLRDRIVISCGGGMVLDEANRKLLYDHFHTVFMYVKAGQSIKRIGKTGTRPLLDGPDPAHKAYELLQERLPHYISSSAVMVNTLGGNAQEITELIYEDYRKTFGS